MHGIRKFQAVDPFGAVRNKGLASENSAGEGIQDTYMLRVLTVQSYLCFMTGRFFETLRCLETVFPLTDFQFV